VGGTTAQVVDALRAWLHEPAEPAPIVIETSGSTGTPKRVVLARRALVASATATAVRLGETGPWLLALPATYVAGVQVIVRSLLAGHEPVEVGAALPAAVERAGAPAFLSLVPTQLRRHLAVPSDVEALRSLHTVLLGGGPIDPGLRREAEDAGIHVVATYGSSETGGGCVYDGYPLDGVSLDVTDGRIRIAGPLLFEGYLDDPALTAQALVGGWFVTSDLGRLHDDGRLEVLGRVDDVVISGGVNVPTPAVARRLLEHPSVAQVEVIGVPDPEWGQRVVAIVVPQHGVLAPSRDEARDWVAAAYPRAWAPYEIFVTEDLPLLANGKVDRVRLQGLFA
jgi:O-succinylbenzoic acid--CoA ligase